MNHSTALRFALPLLSSVLLALVAPELAHARASRPGEGGGPRQVKTLRPTRRHIAGASVVSGVLKLNRSTIDFGTVDFGGWFHDSVAVMNQGDATLTVGAIRITGDDAGAFSIESSIEGVALPVSRFAWQMVAFHPPDSGCFEARLVVTSNAGADSIPLRGCGSYSTIVVGLDTLDFPLTRVDSCTIIESVPNPSGDTLRLLAVDVSGSAFGSALPPRAGPLVLLPGERIDSVAIRFCPDSAGPFTGIASLITDHGIITVVLRGEGGVPMIEVRPSVLDFEMVLAGGHRDLPVLVRSIGSFPLHVTYVMCQEPFTLAPGEPSDFTLAPGASRSLLVRFAPRGAGTFISTDTLRADAPGGGFPLALRGRGVDGHTLSLDTAIGVVGDTVTLHLRLDPPWDSSGSVLLWSARLHADRHALRVLDPTASIPRVNINRLSDDVVEIGGSGPVPTDGLLAAIDILALSTGEPINPVRIVEASLDSLPPVGTNDGSVLLSGCIIGNVVPLARRSAITSLGWDPSGSLAVRYRLPGSASGIIRVVDMLARELLRADVPGPGDQEHEVILPLPGVPAGIYFVELLVADDRSVAPVMRGR